MPPSSGDRAPSILGCQVIQLLSLSSWRGNEAVVERVRRDPSGGISELYVLQGEDQEIL